MLEATESEPCWGCGDKAAFSSQQDLNLQYRGWWLLAATGGESLPEYAVSVEDRSIAMGREAPIPNKAPGPLCTATPTLARH